MAPSVYPRGTTIYYPEQCWNGYTLFQSALFEPGGTGAVLIDMNGNVINQWLGLDGMPNKMLPGGSVMGSTGMRNPRFGYQDAVDVVEVDWEGRIVWKFDKYELVKDPRMRPRWMARQHHDYQREGNPVGYYAPGMEPRVAGGKALILCHKDLIETRITEKPLVDDTIIELDENGKIVWEWLCSEHFDEMGFSEEAKNTLARLPGTRPGVRSAGDWLHVNSMSALGPNRWFNDGDSRFHPDNVIWDSRQANIIAITDRQTGKIVWQVGPYFTATEALRNMGQIIGQHHAHMIPRGLPGEGDILVYDNGGQAGYGAPNPGAPTGQNNAIRDHSRVLEFDPLTLEVIWQYPPRLAGRPGPGSSSFYSSFVSSAQRLPNGNTLITEGQNGRFFEVTPRHEIVWEYMSPYTAKRRGTNMVYRAYRVPYEWVPQVDKPGETAVPRLDNNKFRVPGPPLKKPLKVTKIGKK